MIFASQYGTIDERFTQNFKANSENSKSVRIKRTAFNLWYAHITFANSLGESRLYERNYLTRPIANAISHKIPFFEQKALGWRKNCTLNLFLSNAFLHLSFSSPPLHVQLLLSCISLPLFPSWPALFPFLSRFRLFSSWSSVSVFIA